MNELVIQAPKLQAVLEQIALRGGSSALEATRVASNLVEANLTGHDLHGAGMMPRYVDALLEGGLKVNQHPSVVLDAGSMLRLEGNRGYGQVIGLEAMQLGIQRAKRDGVCVLGIANAHHLGRIGQWAEQCAAEGLVSLHFVIQAVGGPLGRARCAYRHQPGVHWHPSSPRAPHHPRLCHQPHGLRQDTGGP